MCTFTLIRDFFKVFIRYFVRDSTFSYTLCFKINQCVKHHHSVIFHEILFQGAQIKTLSEVSILRNQVVILILLEIMHHQVSFVPEKLFLGCHTVSVRT